MTRVRALVVSMALVACDLASAPPAGIVYDLADRLRVAAHEAGDPDAHPAPLAGGGFRQPAGSRTTWSFALPEGAILRGRVRGLAPPAKTSPPLQLSITFEPEAGAKRGVYTRELAGEVAAFGFEVSLDPGAGMASLHVALEAARAAESGPAVALEWDRLEITAPADVARAPARKPALAPGRNVLIVLFDTLRADYTEPYGPTRVATPAMQGLAASGATFRNAFSNASWTAPSVASLFTGTYPSLHAVRGMGLWKKLHSEAALLGSDLPYLPALLSDAGYATLAILNNPAISPGFGFGRGFDTIHEYWRLRAHTLDSFRTPERQADLVWDRLLVPTLREQPGRPFLAYLHELDPHAPYEAPPPYDGLYGSSEGVNTRRNFSLKVESRYKRNPDIVSAREIEWLRDQYAAEVTFMDAYLARILARLEASGLRKDTLVVFASDHGEALGQHQRLYHGDTLHDEVLRVPLILSLPGVLPEGVRVAQPVQLVDVAPTVLDLLGLPRPPDMQGVSLVPLLEGDAPAGTRPIYAQAHFEGQFSIDSVHHGRYKLIRRLGEGEPGVQLFDLETDPEELRDLHAREPVVTSALRQMLDWRALVDARARTQGDGADPETLDAERREALRALGYLE